MKQPLPPIQYIGYNYLEVNILRIKTSCLLRLVFCYILLNYTIYNIIGPFQKIMYTFSLWLALYNPFYYNR